MSGRVVADEDGVWITQAGNSYGFAWPEITGASAYVMAVPPHDERVLTAEIDHESGEYLTITDDFEGFTETLAAIAGRLGGEPPDLMSLSPADPPLRIADA